MPTNLPKHCKVDRSHAGPISRRGLCPECGLRRAAEAATQMAERSGPKVEAWRQGMKRAARNL